MSSIACCKNILLLHLLLPWLLLPHLRSTAADIPTDTLDKARNMTDGKRLVSDGGSFTLGFFSPGVSTMRYLGVWFSVSEDAVCWVANRDRPLTDTTGVLAITDTGSLLLLDGSGRVVWSSNTTTAAAPGSSPVARLLETGNLVVAGRGSGAVVVWQSFDHPSNTLLPTMKIGKNLWTGHEWYLSSWSSAGDPSTGNYRYATDTKSGAPEDVLWYGTEKRYRTGPWNGRWFSGIPEMGTYSDMFTYRMTISPGEVTYSYVAKDAGVPFSRIVLTDVGVVQRLVWDPSTRSWKTFFQGPRDLCDSYGRCGAFGVCDAGAASTSFCSCARGFSPASPSAWQMRDNSGGCRRNASLDCGSGRGTTTDGFVVVRGVKLPDAHNATVDVRITLEQCRARCLANCSCVAYAPADVGGGATGSGCIIWMEDLVDLRYVDGGQDLYVRSAKSELDEDRSRKFPFAKIVTPVLSFMFIIILVLAIWVWRRKHKSSDAEGIPQNPATTARPVRLRIVKAATANFSQDNMVGQGGFGVVYKGILPDERMIAVKRLNQSALTKKGEQDFIREVEVMAELRHGNLLPLLAYCSAHRERVLIYEYMRKGSLDRYIFGEPALRRMLNWRQRLDIIQGIAHGVKYLHEELSEISVIHRDLKPPNVLLDDNFRPRISDFGTAKLFVEDPDQPDPSVLTIVRSPGYDSPEYLQGDMTLKCDVYSFGVILLETLSGQRNGAMRSLLPHAWELWNRGRALSLLDPMVEPSPEMEAAAAAGSEIEEEEAPPARNSEIAGELARCVQIGLLCVQDAKERRPAMSTVVAMLSSPSSLIDRPQRPEIHGGRARLPLRVSEPLDATTTTPADAT